MKQEFIAEIQGGYDKLSNVDENCEGLVEQIENITISIIKGTLSKA